MKEILRFFISMDYFRAGIHFVYSSNGADRYNYGSHFREQVLGVFPPPKWWSKLTCRLALCRIKTKGYENLDPQQSYVFIANHQGAFDIFLVYGF